ncbi:MULTISPECIES: DUF3958 family protein [unclassified Enterococcus]|uniref:DUF3958 family protein n=1 Tax=unclassified Enterococcus TaxID=2608891 RepID=UPI001CE18E98|nr:MULTISPECIES: DUF3958 family protein [unclassified Enterococcus]MCA5014042.1 DUF3958 family protein [Enterococcus sp. S23]MCA5017184.1 DUF3958 family protein [Enterococcus sp. S22(2020)]
MKKLEVLQLEEQQLQLKEESIANEEKQVRRIKESYEQHFHEARHFLDNLCYLFHKNEQGTFYQSLMDEYSQESRKILEHLEIDEIELHDQKKRVVDQLEDIDYEKRKLLVEEDTNEC